MPAEPSPSPGTGSPDASALLRARLATSRRSVPRHEGPLAPLTATQQGIWYDARVDPTDPAHHRTTVVALRGPLDRLALQRALDAVVVDQPTLRSCYPMVDGSPRQRVVDVGHLPIQVVEAAGDAGVARREIDAATTWSFDLEHEPPVRATLVARGPDDHLLVLAVSHLCIDGPSAVLLVQQLAAAYGETVSGPSDRERERSAAHPSRLDGATFADWVSWRGGRTDAEGIEDELSWWSLVLAGRGEPTPIDPDDLGATPPAGDGVDPLTPPEPRVVPDDVDARLRALARALGVTMNAVTLTAVATIAREELGLDDLVVGLPVTDRDHTDLDDVVGCFVRVLPVRLRLGGTETRRELLARVGATVAAVLDHRAVSMPEILWAVAPRDAAGHVVELVDVFVHHRRDRGDATRAEVAGLDFSLVDLPARGPVPTLTVDDDGRTLRTTSTLLADHLRRLADDPDRPQRAPSRPSHPTSCPTGPNLDVAPPRADAPPPDATIPSLFAGVVCAHADRVAVREGDRQVTYRELEALGNDLAARLAADGIGPGHTVGVRFPRSTDGVVALLGVVLAGAAYVPLDDQAPPERIAAVVDDARLSAVLSPAGVERVDRRAGTELPLPQRTGADAPVYVMYTSGSTGRPKGVVVHHRAVSQLVRDEHYLGYRDDDVIAYASNPTFDTATVEVWGALLSGACLSVVEHDVMVDPAALEARIAEHGITALHPTTSLFHALVRRRPGMFARLRLLTTGGEALDPSSARAVLAHGAPRRFVNDYGPTETTVSASYYDIIEVPEGATTVPIGRPLAAGALHVLDRRGRAVPAGLPGELAIGGDGVALGYLDRPELTASRFVADPFSAAPGARQYLSGDMVYERPDGLIEFIGRVDTQVKVRGYRIELGEIETALMARDEVALAAVRVWRTDDDASIVGYVVPAVGHALDPDELGAALRAAVPAYMLPDHLVVLDELPVTPNGKVDRKALPPVARSDQTSPGAVAPWRRSDLEAMVAVWCDVLDLPAVDADAEFFDLGGHSLRALSLLAAVEDSFGVELRLADLVGAPTPRRLTEVVRSHDRAHHEGGLIELSTGAEGGPVLHLVPACVVVRYVSDYRALVRHLPTAVRVVTYEVPGLAPGTIPLRRSGAMARWYADLVSAAQPDGPLVLCGHSFGGTLALEAARLLRDEGRTVARVVMLDSRMKRPALSPVTRARVGLTSAARSLRSAQRVRRGTDTLDRAERDLFMATQAAFGLYRPTPYDGAVTLVLTTPTGVKAGRRIADEWRPYLPDADVVDVPGAHAGDDSMMTEPLVAGTAAIVAAALGG